MHRCVLASLAARAAATLLASAKPSILRNRQKQHAFATIAHNGPLPPILHGPAEPDLLRNEILADIFEATATRTPSTLALIFGERQVTYGELNTLADAAAHRLIEAGVRPGDMAGLWLPRGIELLLQLAIAKTGAAWLPFDADTPPERIAICLEDASAVALLIAEQ